MTAIVSRPAQSPSISSQSAHQTDPSRRSTLNARWVSENGKLICKWVK